MNTRRNVRAALRKRVLLEGNDCRGKSFRISGKSVDFSRRGLGVLVDREVAPGSVVSVNIRRRFTSSAVVQWSRPVEDGRVRVGLELLNYRAGPGLRIAASLLLCLALIGQLGFSRGRVVRRAPQAGNTCTMSLDRMKTILESALGGYVVVTDSEKAFLHLQHGRLGCQEYTRLYEKSDFFEEKNRAALARWHWTVYHGQDAAARAAEVRHIEAMLQPAN